MDRIISPLLLLILCFSCASQNTATLSYNDYEVLNVFLNNVKPYSFLDEKMISEKGVLKKFKGKFNYQLRFYDNADSICKKSNDTLKLKFYCPLADTFKKYKDILSEKDLDYLEKLDSEKERSLKKINFKKIENQTIQKHSSKYYENVDYKNFKVIPDFNEYPSIRIREIYYTDDKQVAVVVFNIKETYSSGYLNYYILKKQKNIWWKPIGGIKL